jgi:hypothetical protein
MRIAQHLANGASAVGKSFAASWDWVLLLVSAMIVSYAAGVGTSHFGLSTVQPAGRDMGAGKDWAEHWRMYLLFEPRDLLEVVDHVGGGLF